MNIYAELYAEWMQRMTARLILIISLFKTFNEMPMPIEYPTIQAILQSNQCTFKLSNLISS